jgi:2-methylcitrate dehydratase PrpD
METLAFKPYPCGTMTHPYIDCARRLSARGIKAEAIEELICEVAEGTVHRLWEPLADKQRPRNGYAGKFSTPYCIAAAFVRGDIGLDAFTEPTTPCTIRACSLSPPRCAIESIRRTRIHAASSAISVPGSPTVV